ncbi:MAG: hypothetical protein K9N10_23135 [Deltaproteobacteria bacterium]|nr:hypothetical protein [Deltaproteobacteria bacterium]
MNVQNFSKQLADVVGINIVQETLKKLAVIEAAKCVLKMEKLRAELRLFEERFNERSEDAWEKFKTGKSGDSAEMMDWMMLFENYLALERQHKKINNLKS